MSVWDKCFMKYDTMANESAMEILSGLKDTEKHKL